ncbi:MAG: hypothetical protein WCF16_08530, partial [Alphaproteobacteria bacterium]
MTVDEKEKIADLKTKLRWEEMTWRANFDRYIHSDRAAVDIGLVALRTAILINAGAVVALLAFVAQIWQRNGTQQILSQVLSGMRPFLYGLVSAGLAGGIAYIYQS